jgi:hypothetical protein
MAVSGHGESIHGELFLLSKHQELAQARPWIGTVACVREKRLRCLARPRIRR